MAEVLCLGLMLLAILLYFFHDALVNPHGDDELIIYAKQFLISYQNGYLTDFYLLPRKYPFVTFPITVGIYVADFFLFRSLKTVGMVAPPSDPYFYDWLFNLSARVYPVLCTIGIIFLILQLTKKTVGWRSVVLLASSVFLIQLGTSVRPHIIVTFWTLLSFFCAVRWQDSKKSVWITGSFAAATMAFCSLQNGLLAFLFPTVVLLNRQDFRKNLPLWIGGILASAIVSVLIGYPLLLSKFLLHNPQVAVGLDLGHNYPVGWNGHGFIALWQYCTNDIVLAAAALAGAVIAIRHDWRSTEPMVRLAAGYVIIYLIIFGLNINTQPRFYVAVIPYLVLLSLPLLKKLQPKAYVCLILFSILLQAKFVWLASHQNNYQIIRTELHNTGGGQIYSKLPFILFDEDTNRRTEDEALAFFKVTDTPSAGAGWVLCTKAVSNRYFSRGTPLWNDETNGLAEILTGRRSGLNLYMFCKDSLIQQPIEPVTL